MRLSRLPILLVLLLAMCVDRFDFSVGESDTALVVNGLISDRPGPYRVTVAKAVQLDAKLTIKVGVSVKKLVISDNAGNSETLTEIFQGTYETNSLGIRGQIGRAYKIMIETLDGRTYESKPDTIVASGQVEKVYYNFKTDLVNDSTRYSFDVFFDSNAGGKSAYHYLWRFVGTYQIETNPELFDEPCGESRCPKPRPCSGYNNAMVQVGPCTCCTCWANLVGDLPIISDNQFVSNGKFEQVKITNIPVSPWVFLHKVHVEVQQQSLSPGAFAFWKGIKDQKESAASLFQPITGRIPTNFEQTGGPAGKIDGLFYATSISSAATFIRKEDIPNVGIILQPPSLPFKENCIFWGNATTVKPVFWVN